MKPHLKLVGDGAVQVARPVSAAVAKARQRHGKPFAHESGSTFKPRETPLLTEWMATRTREGNK